MSRDDDDDRDERKEWEQEWKEDRDRNREDSYENSTYQTESDYIRTGPPTPPRAPLTPEQALEEYRQYRAAAEKNNRLNFQRVLFALIIIFACGFAAMMYGFNSIR